MSVTQNILRGRNCYTYEKCLLIKINVLIEKKQKRNNGNNDNNSNYDDSNSVNDNSFINENNCQTPKKQSSFITVPYKGQQGEKVIKSFKTGLYKSLPNNIETKLACTGRKLDYNFEIKKKTKFNHKHDLDDYVKYPDCNEDYVGEIGKSLHERI